MKRFYLIMFLFLACQGMVYSIVANKPKQEVAVAGHWEDSQIRSVIPAAPKVYIEGDVISVVFDGDASELFVTVTGQEGEVVYNNNYIAPFSMLLPEDEIPLYPWYNYSIKIEHPIYGYVEGEFTLD